MPITVVTDYFLHVQDFVDAYIGPFPTADAAQEHYEFTRARGDGAIKIGIITELPPDAYDWVVMTPEEDRNWKE